MHIANWTDPQGITHRLVLDLELQALPGFVFGYSGDRLLQVAQCELRDKMKVPAHLTEAVFRRYEDVIQRIVENPTRLITIPSTADLSARTIAARLRDAINSHTIYKWRSKIDPAKLAELRTSFVIRQFVDSVEIVWRNTASPDIQSVEQVNQETTLVKPDLVDLHSVARLLSRRLVTGPYRIVGADPKHIAEVEQSYDIGIIRNQDETITLV
jgi:hypothetical protein